MKIITSIVAAISCKEWQESDHWNGCIFPTSADQDLISNDPYAAFTLDAGGAVTGTANYQDGSEMGPVYSDGSLLKKQCAESCDVDQNGEISNCSYGENTCQFQCLAKEGKGVRSGNMYYIFAKLKEGKAVTPAMTKRAKAQFFRTGTYTQFRNAGRKLLCPEPALNVLDPVAICGSRPDFPAKGKKAHDQWTEYNGDNVECVDGGKFVRDGSTSLGIKCAKYKGDFMWIAEDGKKVTVGKSNNLKPKYLCVEDPDYEPSDGSGDDNSDSGSGENDSEGSGADSSNEAEVSM